MRFAGVSAAVISLIGSTKAYWEEQEPLVADNIGHVKQVAIIGAGAAGASTAYHLSKFAAAADIAVNITVFERNSYVGGRSTTVNAYDDERYPVELGASIFVEVNTILVNATREFNLSTSALATRANIPGAALAVWDGQELVLTQASRGWWDTAKLLWKYGLAPLKTMRLVNKVIGTFLKMYEPPAFPFESLSQIAQDLGLQAITAATGEQYMEESGISGPFGHDVVQASTRVNYAQNLAHLHALEAMVCMAVQNAQAVEGGNRKIFERMIAAGNATLMLQTGVKSVEERDEGGYRLDLEDAEKGIHDSSSSQYFDEVVLAGPFQFSNVSLAKVKKPDIIPYVELHVTLFTSPHLLSPAFFNMPSAAYAPRVVLTTLPKNEKPRKGAGSVGSPGFFSISLLDAVTNPATHKQEYIYKIFSASPPTSTFLQKLLGLHEPGDSTGDSINAEDISWIHRKVWNSYPYEYPRMTFEDIQLDDHLWYTGGMDSFISTMETNALMGMNVARLIVDGWLDEGLQ